MLYFARHGYSRYGTHMDNLASLILARALPRLGGVTLLALLLVTAPGTRAAGSCDKSSQDDALTLVRTTTVKLFDAVKAYNGVISENPADARKLVDEYITPHVDLEGFSRLVLGKHWREASDEQRKQFLDQVHRLILRTYATAVTSYTGIEIEYLPMREESRENFATVRTVIPASTGEGLKVSYRLHCRDNVWKLFDVNIAGVSMVTTYRTTFSAEVKKSGLDGLIKVLEAKNNETGA